MLELLLRIRTSFINFQNQISKHSFILFLATIIFFRLPPFQIQLFLQLSTHTLARVLLIVIFILALVLSHKSFKSISPILSTLIILYLLSQGVSVLGAKNISSFLGIYKDIVSAVVLFLLGTMIINTRRKLLLTLKILLASVLINSLIEITVFLNVEFLIIILKEFTNQKYWDVLEINATRNRFFVDIYDSALAGILLYFSIVKNKITYRLIWFVSFLLVVILSLLSNFRSHIAMILISLTSSYVALYYFYKKVALNLGIIIVMTFTIFLVIFPTWFQTSTIDRIVSPDQLDYKTVTSRFQMWDWSIDMMFASPIFGVGLGNYYDNLKLPGVSGGPSYQHELDRITLIHPHNIFFGVLAETGVLGFLSLTLLMFYFLHADIKQIKKNNIMLVLIGSFWSLFAFSLFNPPITIQFWSLFWLLRVLIVKCDKYKAV